MKWRENPAAIRPMLATLADPPLTGTGLVYEPKYDGIRALVDVAPGPGGRRCPHLVAPGQREDVAVSVDRSGPRRVPDRASSAAPHRRRDRRARRARPAGGIPAAAGTHPPDGRAGRRGDRPRAADGVHRVRPAARRRRGSPRAAADRAPRAARGADGSGNRPPAGPKGPRQGSRGARRDPAPQRAGDRRRPRARSPRPARRMGRPDRQGRARAVSLRPPQPGLAQAEAPAAAGIRRRRLDRAATDAPVLRRAAARRARREAAAGR